MTINETIKMYEILLRSLLPVGGYDQAPNTNIADDIYGHATALAQTDLDAKRLLKVIESIPPELLEEYEREYGLPLKCQTNIGQSFEERLAVVNWIRSTKNVLNTSYIEQLFSIFNVNLVELIKYKPMQCTTPCTAPVNTDVLRYKVKLRFQSPINADLNCIMQNYLPIFLRYDIEVI
ncbi:MULTISPECIES: DUF2313 domain-containing protein [unclassified Acinetobacter]|uniref:DUF2313 domain-containing protein n=1 Tax=unclassified Acinetobacter TaxID=196816 RepID=UPI0005C4A6E6|nr:MULTISPECIES: DUF2313 domain-containing protein [unclassified Acinetobacter]